ncbi:LysE family translocator [Polaromonas sp. YR568]|uniref:LysE family translocator n=1 Tax=Polaromonas sp. YR568 TaxID=1855301 RepID=UPI00398C2084
MQELVFFGSVAALYLMLAVSPGPNFLVITLAAVSESRRHALCVGLGVSTASVLWASLAAVGLGILISHFNGLQQILQVAGGIYLLYIGIRLIRQAHLPLPESSPQAGRSGWQAYRYGLATNLTNPKSLVFFSSAFATLFTPGLPVWMRVAAVGVVAVISLTWNFLVATLFCRSSTRQGYRRAKRWIDRLTGGLLALFGLRLIFSR